MWLFNLGIWRSLVPGANMSDTRSCLFFFFQAEDGIRDHCVTGVQTCALPISRRARRRALRRIPGARRGPGALRPRGLPPLAAVRARAQGAAAAAAELSAVARLSLRVRAAAPRDRSEERRVGKECRSRWSSEL